MKQQYQSPTAIVIRIDSSSLICTSNEQLNPKPGSWNTPSPYYYGSGYSDYDDYNN